MIAVQAFSVLIVAVLAHESTHYVLLRRAGAEPHFTVRAWGLKGLGWRFDATGIRKDLLAYQWIAGPGAELLVWSVGMIMFPALFGLFRLVMLLSFAGNMLLPGSDGIRAFKSWRRYAFPRVPLFPLGERPDLVRIAWLEQNVLDDPPDYDADGERCQGYACSNPAIHRRTRNSDGERLWLCRNCCSNFDIRTYGQWSVFPRGPVSAPGQGTEFYLCRVVRHQFAFYTEEHGAYPDWAAAERALTEIKEPPFTR